MTTTNPKATLDDILQDGVYDDHGLTREELVGILNTVASIAHFLWQRHMSPDLTARYKFMTWVRRDVEITINKMAGDPECECFDSHERSCEMCRHETPADVKAEREARDHEADEAYKWSRYNQV